MNILHGRHGGASTAAKQREGSGFEPTGRLGPSCVEFACSPRWWVFSGYSSFLPQSKDMQVRLTGDSKFPVGVNMSVSGCLSLYVGPMTDLRPVQSVPHRSPQCQLGAWPPVKDTYR